MRTSWHSCWRSTYEVAFLMDSVLRLVTSFGTGLALFIVMMLVYGVGLLGGWATWSGTFVAAVAINNIAVGMVLFTFWD
jgi:hypothetical protein